MTKNRQKNNAALISIHQHDTNPHPQDLSYVRHVPPRHEGRFTIVTIPGAGCGGAQRQAGAAGGKASLTPHTSRRRRQEDRGCCSERESRNPDPAPTR